MRKWLAKHIFYPAQEAMQGRKSLAYWQSLEESQWHDPGALRQLQSQKLRLLMQHAYAECPFYRSRMDEAGVRPDRVDSIEHLRPMPLLSKADIRTHFERMIATSHKQELIRSCTSGSTGSPLIFFIGRRRARSDVAARLRAHRWYNLDIGDPGIYLWGSPIEISRQDRLKAIRDWLINEKLLSAFELTDEQLHKYADTFLRIKPHYIYSYASTLWRFAQFVALKRPELKGAVRRVAFATGEQMLPHWRSDIIRSLECSVSEEYGCREGGLIAHECPDEAYHIMAENIIVEILGEDGSAVLPGEEGRIVITNLESYAMPFVRYDTGDRASFREGACTCGRTLPMMWRPSGRSFEFLETNSGTKITGVSISRDLKEVEGLDHYRVIQESRTRVRVLVVRNSRYQSEVAEAQIHRCLCARIGPETCVDIEYVDALPPHPSGKYRYVINAMTSA